MHAQSQNVSTEVRRKYDFLLALSEVKELPGAVRDYRISGIGWNRQESLPNYVRLQIVHLTPAEAAEYSEVWFNDLNYDPQEPDGGRVAIITTMSEALYKALGDEEASRLWEKVLTYCEQEWGANTVSVKAGETYIIDVDEKTDLEAMKSGIIDSTRESVGPRYVFNEQLVKYLVDVGGHASMNKAKADSFLVDRTQSTTSQTAA